MSKNIDDVVVENNEAARRFEMKVDEHLAVLEYERTDGRIVFTHTGVPQALSGRGIGSKLVRAALENARIRQLMVVPRCPFVASYIRRHPEYSRLVDPAYRERVLQD